MPLALHTSPSATAATSAAAAQPAARRATWPRRTAALLVLEVVAVTLPVVVLGQRFHFPAILREPAAVALPLFRAQQAAIVPAYYGFMLSALLFVPLSYALRHALAGNAGPTARAGGRLLVGLGLGTAIFQSLGFSRWLFAVPLLSERYAAPGASAAAREAVGLLYDLLNRYAGLTVGEHLGFLAMGAWTAVAGVLLWPHRRTSRLAGGLGLLGGLTGLALAASVGEHFGGPAAAAFAALNLAANSVWTLWLLGVAGWLLTAGRRPARTVVD